MKHYSVRWQRPNEDEILECHKLPIRVLVQRIRKAIKINGSIIIHSIEEEDA